MQDYHEMFSPYTEKNITVKFTVLIGKMIFTAELTQNMCEYCYGLTVSISNLLSNKISSRQYILTQS